MHRTTRLSRQQLAQISQDPQVIKFFEGLMRGPLLDPEVVTLGASPDTYIVEEDGVLIVNGGTVSQIDYTRNATAVPVGVVAGPIPVLAGDSITITYAVAPTVTFLPS
jgi:hypothetical protein